MTSTAPAVSVACGIDIGGSGVKSALVDLATGTFIGERVRIDTPEESTPAAVAEVCRELLEQLEVGDDVPVGVALPAPIVHGTVPFIANLDKSWTGVNLTELMREHLGRPVTGLNDADAAGLAEVAFGAAKDVPGTIIVTTLGTGIGSAVIVDGTLVPNTELGHLEIDGYDADSVPDDIVADRLDSAGYSLALSIDKKSIAALEGATGATISATKTAATESNAYKLALEAKRVLGRKGVPAEGRFLIASPEYLEVLMLDEHYIKQGDLSQELVQQGVVGRIAGFNVFESNNMDYESTTRVTSKKTTTEFIAGHPNWCHRVMEWQVAIHLQDLSGSGKYIGASAVQGRKVYGLKVSKPQTLYIKRTEA